MTAQIVRSLCRISDPRNPEFEFTGGTDKWGNRNRKKVMKYIEPDILFDISIFDTTTQEQLWEMEAIGEVTEVELALWETLNPDEAAARAFPVDRPATTINDDNFLHDGGRTDGKS